MPDSPESSEFVAGAPAVHASNATAATDRTHAGEVVRRLERSLEQLESLATAPQSDASRPPLDFDLPAGFLLSVVIPVYNERATIREVLTRVAALPLPVELIVVDDCSTDGTKELLRKLGHIEGLRVISKKANQGKGAAVRTGFRFAKGDVVIVQDADLEYDPADIPALIRPIAEGRADVVYGSRFVQGAPPGSSWVHRWGNWLLTRASNLTTGLALTDMETCYKAFRREILQEVPLRQNRFGFEPEITAKLARGAVRIHELPIGYHARDWADGKKIGVRDGINALFCIVRYAWSD